MRFCNEVKLVLEEAGWYEGRKVDVSKQIEKYKEYGFEIFDALPKILEEFEGIRFTDYYTYVKEKEVKKEKYIKEEHTCLKIGECPTARDCISAQIFCDAIDSDLKRGKTKENIHMRYATLERAREKVVPIGELSGGEMYIYLTETGKIVDDVSVAGMNIDEAITGYILGVGSCLWSSFYRYEPDISNEYVISKGIKSDYEPELKKYLAEIQEKAVDKEYISYSLENGRIKFYYRYQPKRTLFLEDKLEKVVFNEEGKVKIHTWTRDKDEYERVFYDEWHDNGMIKKHEITGRYGEEISSMTRLFNEQGLYIGKEQC